MLKPNIHITSHLRMRRCDVMCMLGCIYVGMYECMYVCVCVYVMYFNSVEHS